MKRSFLTFINQLKKHFAIRKRAALLIWFIAIPLLTFYFELPARKIEYFQIDAWERLAGHLRKPSEKIVIVGIDAETLSKIKDRWPWPRQHLAELLKKIGSGKPEYIVLDILLQHRQAGFYGEGDQILARTIKDLGNVIMVSFIENKLLPMGLRKMLYQNHELFRSQCLFQGLVWAMVDYDGISRGFALKDNDFGLKSAALWIASKSGIQNPPCLSGYQSIEKFLFSHAKKNGEIPLVTASAIFSGEFAPDYFKDKIVILGATAPILHDFHNTSRGLMTGPRLLAVSIDTLLQKRGAEILQGTAWKLLFIFPALILALLLTVYFDASAMKVILALPAIFIAGAIAAHEVFRVFLPTGSFIMPYLLTTGSIVILKRFMTTIENKMLQAEANAAGNVQKELFPLSPMQAKTHTISGICIPCSSAGGDFFEIFTHHPSGKSFFAVADVMGHGIPAALVTSMIKTILTIHRQKSEIKLENLMSELNQVICQTFNRRKMVSGIFGLYESESLKCKLAIAGHPAAYHFQSDRAVSEIGGKSSPLGLLKMPKINFSNIELKPGDSLVIYTDGIVEALNSKGEQYGYERWEKNLSRRIFSEKPVTDLSELLQDMRNHAEGIAVNDDLTILLLQVKKTAE